MNDLLFIALLIALLYYFFIYSKKSHPDPTNKPFTHPKSTQTNPDPKTVGLLGPQHIECPGPIKKPDDEKELENTLDFLIKGMNDLSKDIDNMK